MFNQWCTIESDPGVFTELVKKIGAPSVQVEEIYSMDDDELITKIQPHIYGFIFLFKWTKNIEKKESLAVYDDDLFFARQVIHNACATQAILSVLLNAPIQIEGDLKNFHEFARQLTSQDRGLALSNSQSIRLLHNSFSRPEPFIFKDDKNKKKKQGDVFHFVSYVPHKGYLYQLDGLQPGPILIGKFDKPQEWIQLAKKQITNRIQKYSQKQVRFNLMVVCEDLKSKTVQQISRLKQQQASIHKKLKSLNQMHDDAIINNHTDVIEAEQNDPQFLKLQLNELNFQIEQKQAFIVEQDCKAADRKEQNIRRKHNYIPLIIQIMKTLSKKKKLQELIQKATKKA